MPYKYRSSITGKYVSKEFAKANPDTTEREKVGLVSHLVRKIFKSS